MAFAFFSRLLSFMVLVIIALPLPAAARPSPATPHHHTPQFFSDSLYCEEEHWDNVELLMHTTANCLTKCQGESSTNSDPNLFVELWEVDELSCLLHKEQGNELHDAAGLEQNPSLAEARCEAVEWMRGEAVAVVKGGGRRGRGSGGGERQVNLRKRN